MITAVPGGIEGDGPFARDYKLYMLCNQRPGVPTRTRLGCTRDVAQRFNDHNSTVSSAATDRRARLAAGWWREVLRIIVPADRDLDARSLLNYWRQRSRKIHRRFIFGVDMANQLRLVYFVNAETLASDVLLRTELPNNVSSALKRVDQSSPRRARRVRRAMRRSFTSLTPDDDDDSVHTAAAPADYPTVFDGISFSKTNGRARRKQARAQQRQQQLSRRRAALIAKPVATSDNKDAYRSGNDDNDDDDSDDDTTISMSAVGETLRDALG